jgi:hypothetical protein
MTIQLSEDAVKHEIATLDDDVHDLTSMVYDLTIVDDTAYSGAADLLKNIKNQIAALEAKHKEMVKTPNDYVKWVNDQFRPLTAKGEELRRAVESKMTEYAAI